GGIVHYRNGRVIRTEREYETDNPFESVILALDTFKESPLVSVPGESYNYTTHGFILLSAVVERAAGMPFAEFVDQRIAEPLGMESFQPDYQWNEIPDRAIGYRRISSRVSQSSDTDVSWKLGGGGYISNIDDLSTFAEGMAARKLLTAESFELIWQSQVPADGNDPGYGLGFGVTEANGELLVSHSGAQEKTRTMMIVLPDSGTTIVAMTNSEFANPGEITAEIRRLMQATTSPRTDGR
ncbi:MAG: serine hydrolase domain-containing protein, partial [Planctomycetota bacterium]